MSHITVHGPASMERVVVMLSMDGVLWDEYTEFEDAAALPGNDPVHKITIMPRGRALGYTMVLPDQDKYSTTRSCEFRRRGATTSANCQCPGRTRPCGAPRRLTTRGPMRWAA